MSARAAKSLKLLINEMTLAELHIYDALSLLENSMTNFGQSIKGMHYARSKQRPDQTPSIVVHTMTLEHKRRSYTDDRKCDDVYSESNHWAERMPTKHIMPICERLLGLYCGQRSGFARNPSHKCYHREAFLSWPTAIVRYVDPSRNASYLSCLVHHSWPYCMMFGYHRALEENPKYEGRGSKARKLNNGLITKISIFKFILIINCCLYDICIKTKAILFIANSSEGFNGKIDLITIFIATIHCHRLIHVYAFQ